MSSVLCRRVESDSDSFGSVQPILEGNISNTTLHQIDHHTHWEHNIPLCRVDFTQYQLHTCTNHVYLVFILNQENGASKWAFLGQAGNTKCFNVYPCMHVPSGPIQIIASRYMDIHKHTTNDPYAGGHTDLNIVYQNFKEDCHYFKLHGVTYEQYMLSITDE